jgi:hypothetical protein
MFRMSIRNAVAFARWSAILRRGLLEQPGFGERDWQRSDR